MDYEKQIHSIEPVWNASSKILILGTFPSVKSREMDFFYGHPQNRFWKVLASIFNEKEPKTISDKKEFLLKNQIALWDVIQSCEIKGSSDSSIKNVIPNDIDYILKKSNITKIYTNGKTAYQLYLKYIYSKINMMPILLPSTSPANASFSLNRLIEEWKNILCKE